MDLTYQIVTNLSCNLDCEYCYERKYARNNKIDDVVDFLHACFERDKDCEPGTGAIIDIIGGEPFMQPKLLIAAFETAEELCRKHNRPYVFSISTNGTLFDRKINQEIIERWRNKLSIGVSIDGIQEQHDKYRIFTASRNGSYDKAVAGYNYLKAIGIRELGIKATFTTATLPYYVPSMKHLIDLSGGKGTVSGNVTYEDVLPRSMATEIANQMIEVLEYWDERGGLRNPLGILSHVAPEGLNVDLLWSPANRERLANDVEYRINPDRVRPYCGTLIHMTCLGFDRKIYGCNRFLSTVTTRQAVAELVGREFVKLDDDRLRNEILNQYQDFPEGCLKCPAKHTCGSCAAAPYENKDGTQEDRQEYHAVKRQCGWTTAKLLVAQWFENKYGTYYSSDLRPKQTCGGSCNCKPKDPQ